MYGTNPLVPMTGMGMTAGLSFMAGYPLMAVALSVATGALTGVVLVKAAARKKLAIKAEEGLNASL